MNQLINVKGMSCAHCERRLENAVKEIKGVKKVKADHVAGVLTVEYNEKNTNIEELINVVRQTGYEA